MSQAFPSTLKRVAKIWFNNIPLEHQIEQGRVCFRLTIVELILKAQKQMDIEDTFSSQQRPQCSAK